VIGSRLPQYLSSQQFHALLLPFFLVEQISHRSFYLITKVSFNHIFIFKLSLK